MKAVILAGGVGSRLSEETIGRPKPMVEIGGRPILWHIMKIYSAHGINDFIICLGYKGTMIKDYFVNYSLYRSDITIDVAHNKIEVHHNHAEPWRVTLVDTGEHTMTGGRLKRVARYVEREECFCFTYGDGVADVDLTAEIAFHRSHRKLATVCAVLPPGRFGALELTHGRVVKFTEKPMGDGGLINGGFFILSPKVIDFVEQDSTVWEGQPLYRLATLGELMAFEHRGFWHPMDTIRDKNHLEELWRSGRAPWKVWE
ncbi:MAG: glucose-1-phosphate cytidylyltransferase [Nitrospira sp.]|nr:glucose-1-phosphate cytidylyltransferase [Nitrospira sp.]MCP9463757.1 glucose-1-phosphate cytidylyltransferase [Nitrospira sp.]